MAVRALQREAATRPSLSVIRGKARRLPYAKVVLVFVFTVFAVAGLQAYLGQEGLRVAELERRVAEAEERVTLLRAKQAQLSAPGRIAEEAGELGLEPDPNPTFLQAPVGHPTPEETTDDDLRAHKALTTP